MPGAVKLNLLSKTGGVNDPRLLARRRSPEVSLWTTTFSCVVLDFVAATAATDGRHRPATNSNAVGPKLRAVPI